MTHYRYRGVETVVDTTKEAEFDYALHRVDKATQEEIARQLKENPRSSRDRMRGDMRLREIAGWDVMFVIASDRRGWVITIAGVDAPAQMEPHLDYLLRAALESLPPLIQALLKGRQKK